MNPVFDERLYPLTPPSYRMLIKSPRFFYPGINRMSLPGQEGIQWGGLRNRRCIPGRRRRFQSRAFYSPRLAAKQQNARQKKQHMRVAQPPQVLERMDKHGRIGFFPLQGKGILRLTALRLGELQKLVLGVEPFRFYRRKKGVSRDYRATYTFFIPVFEPYLYFSKDIFFS